MKQIERRLRGLEEKAPDANPLLIVIACDGESREQAEARARAQYDTQNGRPPPANANWLRVVFVRTGVPRTLEANAAGRDGRTALRFVRPKITA